MLDAPFSSMFGNEQEWCAQVLLSRRIPLLNVCAADGGMIQLARIKLRASAINSRSLMLAAVFRSVVSSSPYYWSRLEELLIKAFRLLTFTAKHEDSLMSENANKAWEATKITTQL